jgi:hypothetical protein
MLCASGRNCETAAAASSTAFYNSPPRRWSASTGAAGGDAAAEVSLSPKLRDRDSCETSEHENVCILPLADLSSGEEIGREYVCRIRAVRSLRRF